MQGLRFWRHPVPPSEDKEEGMQCSMRCSALFHQQKHKCASPDHRGRLHARDLVGTQATQNLDKMSVKSEAEACAAASGCWLSLVPERPPGSFLGLPERLQGSPVTSSCNSTICTGTALKGTKDC